MGFNGRSTVTNSLSAEQIYGTPDMTPTGIAAEVTQIKAAQRLAMKQFSDDEGRAVVLTDVKDRNDVGMVQRGGSRLRFQPKPAETVRIARPVGRKYLDGHIALQRGVARAIYLAHSACT